MKNLKKVFAIMLSMVMALGMITGCGDKKSGDGSKKVVFTYDGEKVTLDEVYIYCQSVASYYKQYYSGIFTSNDVWNMDYPLDEKTTVPLEEAIKRQAVDQLRMTKVIVKHADDYKVKLTDDEKKKAKQSAKSYIKQIDEKDRKTTGITSDTLYTVYTESAIASKVMDAIAQKEGVEVSDEEARVSDVYALCFDTVKKSSDGETTEAMSDKEKEEQKANAQKALERAKSGEDMEAIAKDMEISDASGEKQVSKDSNMGDDIYKELMKLKENDVYPDVVSYNDKYYVLKLTKLNDEEATSSNKETLQNEKKQELMDEKYEKWTKKLDWDYTKKCNKKYMKLITFSVDEETTTATAQTTEAADTTTEKATEKEK